MKIKILIIQESLKSYPDIFKDYKYMFDFWGYENQVCRDAEKLPKIMETFFPNLVFWIYPRSNNIANILCQYRQNAKNLKVVSVDDHPGGHLVEDSSKYYDRSFVSLLVIPKEFKELVKEFFGESYVTDKLNEYNSMEDS